MKTIPASLSKYNWRAVKIARDDSAGVDGIARLLPNNAGDVAYYRLKSRYVARHWQLFVGRRGRARLSFSSFERRHSTTQDGIGR